jgi:hypothetical protein
LLTGDDSNKVIYRVAYGKQHSTEIDQELAGRVLKAKGFNASTSVRQQWLLTA